jgi:predicted phage-related endonuclease
MNILATLTSYKAKKAEIERIEQELKEMQFAIVEYMNGKDELTTGQYKVTYKDCNRTDIDKATLKNKYPEIAKELTTTTTYKRFTVR